MKKNIVDFGQGKIIEFPLEFPILIPSISSFECSEVPVPVQQVRWPEVHGPPGIDRGPASSRAPPAA
jgi:hypothetical protein